MSLLQLPPETLAQIFDDIGSSFFREDLSRLTVCKQWFEFALPACFKCITLSPETLRNLVSSGITKRHPPLRGSLEILDLELCGYHSYISTLRERNADVQESSGHVSFETWRGILNNDLTQLANMAQQSPRLHTLRIRACQYVSAATHDRHIDDLSLPAIRAFLSVENLSVLVLDLSIRSLYTSADQGNDLHICPAIGALLRTLRTLHLRMRSICPDVLKLEHPSDRLRLSVVAINLSQPPTHSRPYEMPSLTCGYGAGRLLQLKADLREQAEALILRMAHPRIIRILTLSLPLLERQSLDVLTGKTMVLDDDVAWDEDGRELQEDSEPESEISSLSDD